MDKRTRILAIVFAVAVGCVLFAKVVYSGWLEPKLQLDDRIASTQEELDKLEAKEALVDHAKTVYRRLANRVGSMDKSKVRNDVHRRLNELIEKNGLLGAKVTPTRRERKDDKTGLVRWVFTVAAEGRLRDVVSFLKDAAEIPHLLRINNPKISLASTSEKNKGQDRMSLKATVEVLVLSRQPLVGKIEEESLTQPKEHIRHAGLDYAMIWNSKPFFEYEKPAPPKPTPKSPIKKDPNPRPDPPQPKPSPRWKDARSLQVCMTLLVDDGTTRRDEVMLYNTKSKKNQYVAVGEDFDGGSLLYVHQRGVLVGREDGEFVYPIGQTLTSPIRVGEANDYPELQYISKKLEREAASGSNAGSKG